jgi:tRNA-dihydrouridine synthase B
MKFMLAPLEDVTDNPFRQLCYNHGADLTFTEMTRLAAAVRKNKSTLRKTEITNNVPTQIQFAALKENNLFSFLKMFKPPKSFAGINFNLGCPSPKIMGKGMGCALMKRVSKVNRLVKIVKDHGHPCSVKIRLGANLFQKEKKVYLNLINGVDADFFIVHARHGHEHYEAEPDYSVFPECVKTGKDIIANGDVDTVAKVKMVQDMGVKGVMVGRAAIRNPAIFEKLKGKKETPIETVKEEYMELATEDTRYKKNILKRLGKEKIIDDEKHVNG